MPEAQEYVQRNESGTLPDILKDTETSDIYNLVQALDGILQKREKLGTKRTPPEVDHSLVDFSSNDYLGLGKSTDLCALVGKYLTTHSEHGLGSTGSRLLSGNSSECEALEKYIALSFSEVDECVMFTSGYTANIGLFGSLPQKENCVVWDMDCHNSIREGIRLCRGSNRPFAHNDANDLRKQLSQIQLGSGIVVVEGVYSMDGSIAPLVDVCDVAEEFYAKVIVDEAHSMGVFGVNGLGLVEALHLRDRVFATVHPFGKALGFHGGAVVGPSILVEYLHNYARSFIYTTALPNSSLVAIRLLWDEMMNATSERNRLKELINCFTNEAENARKRTPLLQYIPSNSPIQALVAGSNQDAIAASAYLKRSGLMAFPIRSPTVPAGTERLRLVLHAHNTVNEVKHLISCYEDFLNNR
eukprot:CFRG5963T1